MTNKVAAINNSDGILDAAITSALTFTWAGAETLKTASTVQTQQNVAFVFAGSTSGSPSFKFGNIQRGMVVVVNDMAQNVTVSDYAGTDSYVALAGTTTVLYIEDDRLETIVTSNSVPEAANDGARYVRQSLGWSDSGGLVTVETGTTDSLTTADVDDTIQYTNAGAITVTIPLNSSQAIRVGGTIRLIQGPSAGVVTASPTGGVTLLGATATTGANTQLLLIKLDTDTWLGVAASGISDATNDGNIYARQSATWTDIGQKVNTTASSSITLALTDRNDTITCTASGAITCQLPQNSTTAFPVGTWIRFILGTAGTSLTLSAGTGATVRGTKLVANRPGEELFALKTDTNTWYVFHADTGGLYNVSGFFTAAPVASELLLKHVFSETVYFPDNFAGSVGHVGTNPAATFDCDVKKNGSSIGTISVSTGGAVTFTTSGSGEESFASGDRIEIVAPATPDASVLNFSWTLKGRK
jgi:hypothetical protein